MTHTLVLLRHGESQWNRENRFTGWTDVDLSENGVAEARSAGKMLRERGYSFDTAFTSVLKRAVRTLWLAQEEMDAFWLPVRNSWRLNERHYGALQGLNKAETAAKYGEEQVKLWRRSFDVPPPLLARDDPRFPGRDPHYRSVPESELPLGESLKDTIARFNPFWQSDIAPFLLSGRTALVCAHGNTLRAVVKLLDNVSDADIAGIEIPTGMPLVYELDDNLHPLRHFYLGDEAAVKKAMAALSLQGKAKK